MPDGASCHRPRHRAGGYDKEPAAPVSDCPALYLCPDFIAEPEATELYSALLHSQTWPANHYEVFGRRFELPRLQTWHADPGIVYSYSNNLLRTRPWTPLLQSLRARVEQALEQPFNAVLMNYYRNGNDYVGWHADDEAELGPHPLIASLSLGGSRPFAFRRHHQPHIHHLNLASGSLLTMQPAFQQHWQHSVPPRPDLTGGRINLTFRFVLPPPQDHCGGSGSV